MQRVILTIVLILSGVLGWPVYAEATAPLISFYEGRGLLKKTPGDLKLEEQVSRLTTAFEDVKH